MLSCHGPFYPVNVFGASTGTGQFTTKIRAEQLSSDKQVADDRGILNLANESRRNPRGSGVAGS
jgi:hypothetical protein